MINLVAEYDCGTQLNAVEITISPPAKFLNARTYEVFIYDEKKICRGGAFETITVNDAKKELHKILHKKLLKRELLVYEPLIFEKLDIILNNDTGA